MPTSPLDLSSLKGRTVVITGASDGIGRAATRAIHHAGAHVLAIGRSPEKTAALARELGCDTMLVDYENFDSVKALAASILDRYSVIDVLINNAGLVSQGQRTVTPDGHERTFQINHLSPFLLTNLLGERLANSRAHIITTSSAANLSGHIELNDLESERAFRSFRVYGTTKLMNILFTKELARRWSNSGITATAFHPGVVATNFGADNGMIRKLYQSWLGRRLFLTPEKGADTLLWLASTTPAAGWTSGSYYAKRKLARTNPQASDDALARTLWIGPPKLSDCRFRLLYEFK